MTQRLRNSNLEELNSQVYCHWKVSHYLKPTYNHGSWAMNHESSFGNLWPLFGMTTSKFFQKWKKCLVSAEGKPIL